MNRASRSAPRHRRAIAGATVIVVALAMSVPAYGHGGGETSEADVLVRQAIALIVNTPGDTMGIEDKISDALEDDDTKTVDLELVAKAKTELGHGDTHRARAYLEASIGARPHISVRHLHPIRVTAGPLARAEVRAAVERATGGESGTNVAIDGLPANRDRGAATWLTLAALAAVVGLGLGLAIRYRPPVPIRQLRIDGSDEETPE